MGSGQRSAYSKSDSSISEVIFDSEVTSNSFCCEGLLIDKPLEVGPPLGRFWRISSCIWDFKFIADAELPILVVMRLDNMLFREALI